MRTQMTQLGDKLQNLNSLVNQDVNDTIRAKTNLQCLASEQEAETFLHSRYAERKFTAQAIKKPKMHSWENFKHKLDFSYQQANKVFYQSIRRFRHKRSVIANSINDQTCVPLSNEEDMLGRWREYINDVLSPVTLTLSETQECICGKIMPSLRLKSSLLSKTLNVSEVCMLR